MVRKERSSKRVSELEETDGVLKMTENRVSCGHKEFKDTEIRRIPKEWEILRLDEVLSLKNGERPQLSEDETIPVYGANGIMGYSENYLVDNDFTIIIGRVGASGEVHLGTGKIWVSDNAIYSEKYEKDRICLPWLYYFLKFKQLGHFATKTTHPIITQSFLNSYRILRPPLPEQRRIAEILSTVDQAIQRVDEAIARTERLKRGLMQRLLTRGIGHEEFRDTEIGRIPKGWEVIRLGEMATEIYRYPTYFNIEYEDGRVPEVRGELIEENGELQEDLSKYRFISKKTSQEFPRTILRAGDFVLSVRGTIGKIAIVPQFLEGANITANLMRVSLDRRKCYPPFFKQVFLSDFFKKMLGNVSSQTTIKTIQAPILKSIKVPLPHFEEQQKIAEILSTVDKKLELERKRKEKLESIKRGLMNDLLTGKVRVKT